MTDLRYTIAGLLLLILIAGCSSPEPAAVRPVAGQWLLDFSINDSTNIQVRVEMGSLQKWTVWNWTEQIPLDDITWSADSFHVKMPLFNTALHGRVENDSLISGNWHDYSRSGDYHIPFKGVPGSFSQAGSGASADENLVFSVTFNPETDSLSYPSIGSFQRSGNDLYGTFMTETGDYRYLQGHIQSGDLSDKLQLSCFDGTHLFHFSGDYFVADSAIRNGQFYSGNHSTETWSAKLDPLAGLSDPDSLTHVVEGFGPLSFSVMDSAGIARDFGLDNFRGKVTLVQLHGTWCPNCTDESIWLGQLYNRYHARGLEVIPVAFERNGKPADLLKNVARQFKQLGLPYASYLGGEKNQSALVFPMLNHIMSYPTLLIVDKNGMIRKIHTGFYGPGTGAYHDKYTGRLEQFIEGLLAE
ncbi:MAG: TlpA family protein disulfide reductase [Flavobacteriales bacterium]|nr:TlpA family protein disulfide reductase [Flavobacteriales bacterium]